MGLIATPNEQRSSDAVVALIEGTAGHGVG